MSHLFIPEAIGAAGRSDPLSALIIALLQAHE